MTQIEIACKELVFHFNKKHLEDPTIPMWIIMTKGKTYYVDHVEANIPWTTKETPNNIRTKGAIKFKNALLRLEDSSAKIEHLTEEDKARLDAVMPVRIAFHYKNELLWLLEHNGIKHGPCKNFKGLCGGNTFVLEIAREDLTMLALVYPNNFYILPEDNIWYVEYENETIGKVVTLDPDYEGKIENDLCDYDELYEE